MKNFKTVLAIVLAVIVIASLAVTASAAYKLNKPVVNFNSNTIQITKGDIKCQYGISTTNDIATVEKWQYGATFTDLEAETTYYVFSRTPDGALVSDATEVTTPKTASQWKGWLNTLTTIIPFVLIIVAFWFFLIRPQKKQEKKSKEMLSSIEVGDIVTTIGGISGVVRQIKEEEDSYVIETGADKSKVVLKKWAIQSKDTVTDNPSK